METHMTILGDVDVSNREELHLFGEIQQPLDPFADILNKSLDGCSEADMRVELKLIAVSLKRELEHLLVNDFDANMVAGRSFEHTNGFVKIVLKLQGDSGRQIRLHMWRPRIEGAPNSIADIHDHRWAFISVPLFGRFTESRYEICTSGQEESISYLAINCYPRDGESMINIDRKDEISIKKVSMQERVVGDAYFCDVGIIHSIDEIASGGAITLVLMSEPKNGFASVYKSHGVHSIPQSVLAPSLSLENLRIALKYIISKI